MFGMKQFDVQRVESLMRYAEFLTDMNGTGIGTQGEKIKRVIEMIYQEVGGYVDALEETTSFYADDEVVEKESITSKGLVADYAAGKPIKKKPLLTIELEDMNSTPIVKYKGEELLYKKHVKFDWEQKTDKSFGGVEFDIKHHVSSGEQNKMGHFNTIKKSSTFKGSSM